jgi:hypothetical protein
MFKIHTVQLQNDNFPQICSSIQVSLANVLSSNKLQLGAEYAIICKILHVLHFKVIPCYHVTECSKTAHLS